MFFFLVYEGFFFLLLDGIFGLVRLKGSLDLKGFGYVDLNKCVGVIRVICFKLFLIVLFKNLCLIIFSL